MRRSSGARKGELRSAIRAQNEELLVRGSIAPSIFLRQIIGCRISCRSLRGFRPVLTGSAYQDCLVYQSGSGRAGQSSEEILPVIPCRGYLRLQTSALNQSLLGYIKKRVPAKLVRTISANTMGQLRTEPSRYLKEPRRTAGT